MEGLRPLGEAAVTEATVSSAKEPKGRVLHAGFSAPATARAPPSLAGLAKVGHVVPMRLAHHPPPSPWQRRSSGPVRSALLVSLTDQMKGHWQRRAPSSLCSRHRAQSQAAGRLTVRVKVAQSCPTLCHAMDYTVHEDSLGQNTGVGSLSLLQAIFPTQGSSPGLPHCRWILHQLSHQGSPGGRLGSRKQQEGKHKLHVRPQQLAPTQKLPDPHNTSSGLGSELSASKQCTTHEAV